MALLTGGRVRIGYQIALRLLRCGAECHITSRFVADAALRFSLEHDYAEWRENLHLYYLELCDLQSVEQFAVRAFCRPAALLMALLVFQPHRGGF